MHRFIIGGLLCVIGFQGYRAMRSVEYYVLVDTPLACIDYSVSLEALEDLSHFNEVNSMSDIYFWFAVGGVCFSLGILCVLCYIRYTLWRTYLDHSRKTCTICQTHKHEVR